MAIEFQFQYRFHPVGQGIFASGSVSEANPSSAPFHWVFDCGAVSRAETLVPAVERYKDLVLDNYLDLLCISHFDKDHVNGLGDLLSGLRVGTVVLPYCSSLERLIIWARRRYIDNGYFQFLGNPVAFLLERADTIERIIIVGGPAPDDFSGGLPDRSPDLDGRSGGGRDDGWRFNPFEWPKSVEEPICDAKTIGAAQSCQTQLLHCSTSFGGSAFPTTQAAYWEFLFYHKPIDPLATAEIRIRVGKIILKIRKEKPNIDVTGVLADERLRTKIKLAYARGLKATGQTDEDINSTSLCVYTGPQLDNLEGRDIAPPWPHSLIGGTSLYYWHPHPITRKCALLYTGDANFKRSTNRRELQDFLTPRRWNEVSILQVPHHGSRNNWEVGSSHEFAHSHSVFCADENHMKFKHPHREVLLDLMGHGPVLVNKHIGWSWLGQAYFH